MKKQLAHEQEKGNRNERELRHLERRVVDELLQPEKPTHERIGTDNICGQEREGDGYAQRHQEHDQSQHQDDGVIPGHGQMPSAAAPGLLYIDPLPKR